MVTGFENRRAAKSEIYRRYAEVLNHPTEQLSRDLASGQWQASVSKCFMILTGGSGVLPLLDQEHLIFEASYIDLFQIGFRGRPLVSLNASDYSEILQGQSRPELLVDYVNWYKHFGLRVDDTGQNLLADHITCQLSFLAWLVFLQEKADDETVRSGYEQAERDFIQRHFSSFISAFAIKLRDRKLGQTAKFYADICENLEDFILKTMGSEPNTSNVDPLSIGQSKKIEETVNLWE